MGYECNLLQRLIGLIRCKVPGFVIHLPAWFFVIHLDLELVVAFIILALLFFFFPPPLPLVRFQYLCCYDHVVVDKELWCGLQRELNDSVLSIIDKLTLELLEWLLLSYSFCF